MEKEVIEKLAHLEERNKINVKRIDEHECRLDNLEKTYSMLEKMDYRIGKVETAIEKIDSKLDKKINGDTENKGKKWDKLIDYIFYAVLGIILSYMAVQLGLK